MSGPEPFVDIHCHLLPGLDDGPADWDETLAMAEMAAADGIATIVATPHQLGSFPGNRPQTVRSETARLQGLLDRHRIPVRVLPGADVRVEPELVAKISGGEVLTLADRGRHVLLELPHELYLPLERLLSELKQAGLVGVLSHPERNQGILRRPEIVRRLVRAGCLMQVTAGSLTGLFGPQIRGLAERLVREGLVHFVGSDAHGTHARCPVLRPAFDRAVELAGRAKARELFCTNPARLVSGKAIVAERRPARASALAGWFRFGKAG